MTSSRSEGGSQAEEQGGGERGRQGEEEHPDVEIEHEAQGNRERWQRGREQLSLTFDPTNGMLSNGDVWRVK